MRNIASFSGAAFIRFCTQGYLITFSVYNSTSLPLSNLDCNSNWNLSHRMYLRSRQHLRKAKSILLQIVEVWGFFFSLLSFVCLLSFFKLLILCFDSEFFMLLEFGLVEKSQGFVCMCLLLQLLSNVSELYYVCMGNIAQSFPDQNGLDLKLSKSELQDKIFPTRVYLSHCDHSIFH